MISISINFVFKITCTIFLVGLFGVVANRKNLLLIVMSIELLLLSVNLNFATFSIYLDDIIGQIFVLFILVIAAAESAIGISLISALYRLKNSIKFEPVKIKKFNKF